MSNETGGPAFPSHHDDEYGYAAKGMTLRDYFAAKVIQGYVATEYYTDPNNGGYRTSRWISDDQMARSAYAVADAMLEARK